jgi:site-specific recombinase XerD
MSTTPRIPANKDKKYPAEPLTHDEMRQLIRACSSRSSTGLRNRALIVLMYRTGIRVSEALSLSPKDVDLENGSVRVLRGKGGKTRLLGLDTGVLAVLQVWLDRRAALGIGGRNPIFCTLKGERLHSSYLRTLLPRLAQKAGIERRCHPHALRHSFSYEAASENVPLHVLQMQLGHSNLSTTQRYISHVNPTQVVSLMKSREWSW